MSRYAFVVLVLLVGCQRLIELVVSRRNAAWAMARGGRETGSGHYPVMVALHSALLGGALVEVLVIGRPFVAWLGWPMLLLVLACQALRCWCIVTLGHRWNTRIIVVPGLSRVSTGPYARFRHPNYVAVAVEGFALPLVHSAWVTAAGFTALNLVLLRTRVRAENAALDDAAAAAVDTATS